MHCRLAAAKCAKNSGHYRRVSLMSAMEIPSLGCTKKNSTRLYANTIKPWKTRLARKDAIVRRNSWEIKKGCPSRIKKKLQRQNISAEVLFIDATKPEYAWRINQHYCGYSRGQHPPEVCAARFAPRHSLIMANKYCFGLGGGVKSIAFNITHE